MAKRRSNHSNHAVTPGRVAAFFGKYFWVIIKNVIGWLLILLAFPVAGLFPGPLGTPMFLIGFALVTFPYKRHITSRTLRGIPIHLRSPRARIGRLIAAFVLPPLVVWILALKHHPILHPSQMGIGRLCALYAGAIVAAWIFTWGLLLFLNLVLKVMPRIRRRVRPWLRHHGIKLLPPRRKRRTKTSHPVVTNDQQILEIDNKEVRRVRKLWSSMTRWMRE